MTNPVRIKMPRLFCVSQLSFLAAALFCATSALAVPVVDGNLSDWGIHVGDNNTSTYNLTLGAMVVASYLEDQNDHADINAYLGPNIGGQDYDAEFLGVAKSTTTLYLAIVTGIRPDNGLKYYSPGDILINLAGGGTIGIEVGGGAGGGPGGMLSTGAPGSTYNLDGNGFTLSHSFTAAAQTVGSMWLNPSWIYDPIPPASPTQFQINGSSTYLGNASLFYTRNTVTTQHAEIEVGIPLNLLGFHTIQSISWSPSCGNDIVAVVPSLFVPEPSTFALAGLGTLGVGLAWLRRRSR